MGGGKGRGRKGEEGRGGNGREERASHTAAALGLAKPRADFGYRHELKSC